VQGSTQVQSLGQPLKNFIGQWKTHLLYSHLFGALQDAIHGMKFETNDDVSCAMRSWLHEQDVALYPYGIHTLVPNS